MVAQWWLTLGFNLYTMLGFLRVDHYVFLLCAVTRPDDVICNQTETSAAYIAI